jgi:iron complex outermembrane receptor protein
VYRGGRKVPPTHRSRSINDPTDREDFEFAMISPEILRRAGLTACAPFILTPAFAAGVTEADATSEVVVTGSRLQNRTVTDSPVPIDVLSAEEIRTSGHTEVSKIVQQLIPSFNFPHPTTPDGNTHVRSASLRGLSPDQTLVLVNGKRRHTSAWVNTGGTMGKGAVSTELNAIPPSAIERIEVLRDGASAQYGSDAIAGVINIVLRKDTGLFQSTQFGSTEDGGGDQLQASLNAGVPFGDGSLHATLYYRDREAADRSLPDTRQQYFGIAPDGSPVALSNNYGSGIGLRPPGGPPSTTLDPREATIDREGLWRFADSADTIEKTIFLNADNPVSFGEVTTYAFGGYGVSDGTSNASLRRAGQTENVRAIYPDGFLPYVDTESENYSLGVGARGPLGSWEWDLSTVYGANSLEYRTRNTLNATLGTESPTRFYNGAFKASQWTTNLNLTTALDVGLPAELRVAAGAEYRADTYEISPGEPASYEFGPVRVLDGPAAGTIPIIGSQGFAGIQPGDATDRDRNSYAVYVEVETDLTPKLLLSGAARFEDFSDFGSTTNGKLALRYQIMDGVAARASVSTGFHAPALAQQYFSSTSSRTLNNPDTGEPEYVLVRTAPVTAPEARALGATDLEPEESVSLSAGLTFQRAGLTATIDYYDIRIDDRIFLSSNFVDAPGSRVIRDFLASRGLPGVSSVRYFTNAADTRTKGFDFTARYRWESASLGGFTLTAAYNRNRTRLTEVDPTPQVLLDLGVRTPLFDVIERTRVEKGQPKDSLLLGLDWKRGPLSVGIDTKRYGRIEQVALTNQSQANIEQFALGRTAFRVLPTEAGIPGNFDVVQILEPKWVTDVDLTWSLTEHIDITLGANNVFNVYPTRNIATTTQVSGADTFGVFPYSELSPFGWSGAFYYGRVHVRF